MVQRWWSNKCWKRSARYFRAGALLMLCILLISPLRNMVLRPIFPAAWRTHTSFLLAKMLIDNQHFPVDAVPTSDTHNMDANQAASLTVNLADLEKYMEEEEPFPEFFKQRGLLLKRAEEDNDSDAARELEMLEGFKPPLSRKERAQLLFTMDVFVRACRKHNLTFLLLEGSLLGAHRHHGLIPWDDDVDIGLNASQWRLAQKVLGNIPGFTLYAPPDSQWKFFLSDLTPFPDKPFRWPNLDLFFLTNHDPYVWALTWGLKTHLMLHIQHFLPLTTVLWEGRRLPAPACVERMLRLNYNLDICVLPLYVHKTNEERYSFQTKGIECSLLHKYFPFVFRHQVASDSSSRTLEMVESRMIGGRVLQNVTVPPPAQVCSA